MKAAVSMPCLSALAVLLALFAFMGGCGIFGSEDESSGGDGNTLNDYNTSDIPDLDSTTSVDESSFNVLNNVMEGLYRLNPDDEPIPAMAESLEISDDETAYTFTLRDDITWSDGEPVTSRDFKYAWLRTLDPETVGQFSYLISDYIEGAEGFAQSGENPEEVAIRTPDERTLEVDLTNPTPYFLGLTASPTYFPQRGDFVEERGDDYAQSAEALLYNGPYTMSDFSSTSGYTLEKNPEYWDAANVDAERVEVRIVEDENTALNLYEAGELDTVGLTSENIERYRDSGELSITTDPTSWWYLINMDDPVTGNRDIRRAIQMGFDRASLAEDILANGAVPSEGPVAEGIAGPGGETFRESYGAVAPDFDPDEARRLYERGVEDLGREPTLEIMVDDTGVARDLGTFVQGQLAENLGAEVELNVQPFDARIQRQQDRDFQIVADGSTALFDDPINYMSIWTSDGPFNYVGFSDERYDELVEGAKSETDEQERMDMLAEAESIATDAAAMAPSYYSGSASLIKPHLENYTVHSYGAKIDYKYARLEK